MVLLALVDATLRSALSLASRSIAAWCSVSADELAAVGQERLHADARHPRSPRAARARAAAAASAAASPSRTASSGVGEGGLHRERRLGGDALGEFERAGVLLAVRHDLLHEADAVGLRGVEACRR